MLVAQDPVAAVKYFHTLIPAILRMLGWDMHRLSFIEEGILGWMKAFYGCIEAQGRGSLHLHVELWLDTGSAIGWNLDREEFKNKLLTFLGSIIKEEVPELGETLLAEIESKTPLEHHISCYKPIGFTSEDTDDKRNTWLMDQYLLVNSVQMHSHSSTCTKYAKKGEEFHCRFDFPRKKIVKSHIDENGKINLRRNHEMVNNWNSDIISLSRSNMDIKYLGRASPNDDDEEEGEGGNDPIGLAFYITNYQTKSDLTTHNMYPLISAALQETKTVSTISSAADIDSMERSKKMVIRCVNKLATQRELSAMQVCSYLLNYPDHYTSHFYSNLYWPSFSSYLDAFFLKKRKEHEENQHMKHEDKDKDDFEGKSTANEFMESQQIDYEDNDENNIEIDPTTKGTTNNNEVSLDDDDAYSADSTAEMSGYILCVVKSDLV